MLTYNVHSCRGGDGRTDPARIAEVIAGEAPDIVALQELDVGRARSGGLDQAQLVATHLNMKSHFHPALHVKEEKYGDAILTAFPATVMRAGALPSIGEPRGAIWLSIDIGGAHLQVINTHLGLRRRERLSQVAQLLGPGWLGSGECKNKPAVLLGDFNAVPSSLAYRNIARGWRDAQAKAVERPSATFPSRFPLLRLDHIFVGNGVEVMSAQVCTSLLARSASDHLPVVATIGVPIVVPRAAKQDSNIGAARAADHQSEPQGETSWRR
ncbi:endonuclease/exonuclease/phosphatase family protein [Mesorhizobium sp. CAU 1741]|uniref:endonuclease/exonuclease/phosphatase family protein n=1 Tax=Mesorhizobium sp. CAU 1741 TaxID=3140366 RepID=UPI00325B5869